MPIRYVEKRVNADEKVELVCFLQRALEPADRLQRKVRFASFCVEPGLKVGGNECRMTLRCQRDHCEAMRKGSKRMILFVRRQLRRDEQHFAKLKVLRRALGDGDVSAMNWIEGTAEKGEVHGRQFIRPLPLG